MRAQYSETNIFSGKILNTKTYKHFSACIAYILYRMQCVRILLVYSDNLHIVSVDVFIVQDAGDIFQNEDYFVIKDSAYDLMRDAAKTCAHAAGWELTNTA